MASSPPWYALAMVVGIGLSLLVWTRMARHDARLPLIYLAGLVSAFIGAKLAYLLAEGWRDFSMPHTWLRLATGKSILGALAGGYAGVELVKRWLDYRAVTGDLFAVVTPIGIICGRIGCLLHGCCLGQVCAHHSWWTLSDATGAPRWPAVPLEIVFNLLFLLVLLTLRQCRALAGQHFHLYLIGYGLFRFVHELVRDTPRVFGPFSGYALIALALAGFGGWAAWRRARFRFSAGGRAVTDGSDAR